MVIWVLMFHNSNQECNSQPNQTKPTVEDVGTYVCTKLGIRDIIGRYCKVGTNPGVYNSHCNRRVVITTLV